MRPPGQGGAPDVNRILEQLPLVQLSDLRPNETIVVSSTKGAKENQVTAIVVVANAGMLIQLATPRTNQGPPQQGVSFSGLGGGMQGGMGGFEVPGMIQ